MVIELRSGRAADLRLKVDDTIKISPVPPSDLKK